MNKQELVSVIAKDSELSKKDSKVLLNSIVHTVSAILKDGQEVQIAGFGTFAVISRPLRKGRNPQTGEIIQIKASKSPRFRPSRIFKNVINLT